MIKLRLCLISTLLLAAPAAASAQQDLCPLCQPAALGDAGQIEFLLSKGANLEAQGADGATPLFYAINHNQSDAAILLLQHHANPNVRGSEPFLTSNHNHSPLMSAVILSEVLVVQALLNAGAEVNATDTGGCTAICYALAVGLQNPDERKIFDLLISAKASLRLQTQEANKGMSNFFTILLAHALTQQDKHEDASAALQRVSQLLAGGVDPNLATLPPITLLIDTPDRNYKDLLALLLAYGADPNTRDPLLLLNNTNARRDVAELLINNGLEIELRDKDNTTALTLAVESENLAQAKLLLSLGAGTEVPHTGAFPLAIAAGKGNVEMVRLLLDHGANPQSFIGPQQQKLTEQDVPNPEIRKLLQDRLTLQRSALSMISRYMANEADMQKAIHNHAIPPADAQRIAELAAAAPADPGFLVLSIIFSVGSGENGPIPQGALQHEQAGNAAYATAASRTQFVSAANEFVEAARLAPWMPAYPRNACLLFMMGGAYAQAGPLCYAYKTVAPSDTAFDQILAPYTQKEAALLFH
jgi:ankyrin repeat protein